MLGRLSAVVYACFSMAQRRIFVILQIVSVSFCSGLLASSLVCLFAFLFLFFFFIYIYLAFSLHAFSFSLFFLRLASIRVEMS